MSEPPPTRSPDPGPISVVVPTRDRPESLARCLAALAAQDAGALEIVIVDDGSHDRGAVEAALGAATRGPDGSPSRGAPPRLLRAPGRGPAAARNVGARAATGEVICFTDDDCEPERGWARMLAERAATTGSAAGRTLAPPGASAAVLASQAIVEHLQLSSLDRASGTLGFAPTCNLAATREALGALPFDESFPGAASEDREWSARALAAGLSPTYEPAAVVIHRQRLDARGILGQGFRYGRGASRFRASAGRGLAPPRFYAGLVRGGFRHGARAGGLVLAAQAATAAGAVAQRLSAPDRHRDPGRAG